MVCQFEIPRTDGARLLHLKEKFGVVCRIVTKFDVMKSNRSFTFALIAFALVLTVRTGSAQTGVPAAVKPLVDAEQGFADLAARQGIRQAFLTNLADDGVVFEPTERNGKQFWKSFAETSAFLSWKPVWADMSSDARLGYTVGPWEYRAAGKSSPVAATGSYLTIWLRQADGSYKAILDIGVAHPATTELPFSSATEVPGVKSKIAPPFDGTQITDIFSQKNLAGGYFEHMSEDVRVLREGVMPFVGKSKAFVGIETMDRAISPDGVLNFGVRLSAVYGNLLYATGTYDLTFRDKSTKKWSFVQIWKLRDGKWVLVADVFKPVPDARK